jgi:heat shock protein HslJ
MKPAISTLLLLAVMALAGCRDWFPPVDPNPPKDPKDTTHTNPGDTSAKALAGKKWCLVSIDGIGFNETVDPTRGRYLEFDAAGHVIGNGGPNRFNADYAAKDGAISITNWFSTKIWTDSTEGRFFSLLKSSTSYKVDNNALRLINNRTGETLRFERCDSSDTVIIDDPQKIFLDREFKLKYGASGELDNASPDVFVRFDGVVDDSRCPLGMLCIWAGDASVLVTMTVGTTAYSGDLHTNSSVGPQTFTAAGYDVTLVEVDPVRMQNTEILPDQYSVVLKVSKH